MSNKIIHTDIPTARLFDKRGYGWNPIKGCDNKKCHLHPKNKGECWAAQMCNRMAGPWAESEANRLHGERSEDIFHKSWDETYLQFYQALKNFKPTWLESQFEKKFPKERSCILVGYMTDIAFIPRGWVQRIIDKIKANNEEREAAGLLLHVFQFLTKDPSVYAKFKWPANCWLGFTACNQSQFNKRLQEFRELFNNGYEDHVFYAYLEPLESKIILDGLRYILNWVIVGGGSTPLHPDWVRSIRDQCQVAGVPLFFKSWGEMIWFQNVHYVRKRDFQYMNKWRRRNDKPEFKENILDGKVWEQFPEVK